MLFNMRHASVFTFLRNRDVDGVATVQTQSERIEDSLSPRLIYAWMCEQNLSREPTGRCVGCTRLLVHERRKA